MAKPEAVRKQEEAADQMLAQMMGTSGQDTSDEDAQASDTPTEGHEADHGETQPEQDAQGEHEQETPNYDGQARDHADTDADDWKAKYDELVREIGSQPYRTLQGKYNAEVPALNEQVRKLKEHNRKLQEQVDQSGQESSKPEKGAANLSDEKIQQIREDFGEDFLEAVKAVASSLVGSEVQEVKQRTEQLAEGQEQMLQDSEQDKERRFWRDFGALVPDWEAINARSDWKQWLGGMDPQTGKQRQQQLNEARSSRDPQSSAAVFEAFKADAGITPANAQKDRSQEELARQVSPGKSKGDPGNKPSKPQYTVEDFQNLQEEFRRGKWRGREDEFKAKERAIHAAITGSG